jgi:hypothetical protein
LRAGGGQTVGVWFKPGFDVIDDVHQASAPEDEDANQQHFRRGIVYYVHRGKVVGILLCNCAEMLEQARDVLRQQAMVTSPLEELPNLILLAPRHWLRVLATK